ncbi:hypothetical protein FA15DRAFT_588812, partial [Coprinopsis marcescibilis]
CHRQFAKYTCPGCNTPYCSLTCFRSDSHSQCSEPFYKNELETGIRAEPSKTAEERSTMLGLLRRFEEENADEGFNVEDDDDNSDLARRLSFIDLDNASPDALWSALTPKERERFVKALNDPSSELAQQLLSSDELHKQISEPWWARVDLVPEEEAVKRSNVDHQPRISFSIPEALLKPVPNRPLLAYNISAISIVYAFVVRHLGLSSMSEILADEDFEVAYQIFARSLPFLIDRKSTVVFQTLDAVITDLASRFASNIITSDLFSVLLQDSSEMMTPKKVTQISTKPTSELDLSSHPHQLPLLFLSDIYNFFSTGLERHRVPQSRKHLTHKLVFYAAHVVTMPSPLLRAVAHELEDKGKAYRADAESRKQLDETLTANSGRPSQSNNRIEDLSNPVPREKAITVTTI